MDPTVTGALIGAGGAVIVAVAGFLANVRITSVTTAASQHAVKVSQQAVEAAQRTVELTEQGQVADRYTKAIYQLGSDKLEVRIGGIYSLERIARDSPQDHPTVMDVLTAFIRDHSREQWQPAEDGDGPPERPDVQAAARVIGRRATQYDTQLIDLSGAILIHANFVAASLSDANFVGADLTHASLDRAKLIGAQLRGADLAWTFLHAADLTGAYITRANLTYANLTSANLTSADLTRANLTDVLLTDANLTGTDLTDADLTRADLTDADLTRADLTDAKLTDASLTGADLTRALWPSDATVPEGWQRDINSDRLKRADTGTDGATPD